MKHKIAIFTHHNVGTILMSKVFNEIAKALNLKYVALDGEQSFYPPDADIVQYLHSLISVPLMRETLLKTKDMRFKGIHLRRDPRDVIISGYQYHLRCNEAWCINPNYPFSIPESRQRETNYFKTIYRESLKGKSYQENLQSLSGYHGLFFEMDHYGAWTIGDMMKWHYGDGDIEEISYESIIVNYDETFDYIFSFLGFEKDLRIELLDLIKQFDLNRMTEEEREKDGHISDDWAPGKHWNYFEQGHREYFKYKFPGVLQKLGYVDEGKDW